MREFSLSNRRRRRSTRGSCTMMMRMSRWTQPRDGPRRSREGSSSGGRDFFIRKRSQKTYWKPEKNKLTALKKHDHSLKSKHVDSRKIRANILTNKWWQLEEKKISNSLKKLADSLKKPCWQLEEKKIENSRKNIRTAWNLYSQSEFCGSEKCRAGHASLKSCCVSRRCAFLKRRRVSRLCAGFLANISRIPGFASSSIASVFCVVLAPLREGGLPYVSARQI